MDCGTFTVPDTTEGWAQALRIGLDTWIKGYDIEFDFSQIRPAGSVLKTKGGRASGPQPLIRMLKFIRQRILDRQGNRLRPIDVHDIVCEVGNAAVSGGMRRTAMISLFDYNDMEMRLSKDGNFSVENSQRWNANNSAVWPERMLSQAEIQNYVTDIVKTGRGEPGIFSRKAAKFTMPERRDKSHRFGTNPCGEIVLRPMQLCNLSIAVARHDDDLPLLKRKVKLATIIGTIQSMATNFPGLREQWKKNCEEERLLGVDITGQMDSVSAQWEDNQKELKKYAVEVNKEFAAKLGINQSASVTCVKPSGNSSQLLDCSAGIHSRWSKYYIRNIRVGAHTPIFKVLKDAGVPMDPENGQTAETANTWVIHFPVKAPENSTTRHDHVALEQCAYWRQVKLNYTEHNPSVTISYKDDEVIDLTKWIWRNQNIIGGMAFLPASDAKYNQMPFEEIDEETYNELANKFPPIDFSKLYRYEEEDFTTAAQELACMAGSCDII
jgi:ribonucleoside-diphosphate reductase alpha chain